MVVNNFDKQLAIVEAKIVSDPFRLLFVLRMWWVNFVNVLPCGYFKVELFIMWSLWVSACACSTAYEASFVVGKKKQTKHHKMLI